MKFPLNTHPAHAVVKELSHLCTIKNHILRGCLSPSPVGKLMKYVKNIIFNINTQTSFARKLDRNIRRRFYRIMSHKNYPILHIVSKRYIKSTV